MSYNAKRPGPDWNQAPGRTLTKLRRTHDHRPHDMLSIEQIKSRFDLLSYAARATGAEPGRKDSKGYVHLPGNGGLFVNAEAGRFSWFSHDVQGDALDFIAYLRFGVVTTALDSGQFREVRAEAAQHAGFRVEHGQQLWNAARLPRVRSAATRPVPIRTTRTVIDATAWQHVTTYDYYDEQGKVLYSIDRWERHVCYSDAGGTWKKEKEFKQWHINVHGERVGNVQGVRLVLYELPAVLSAIRRCASIWVVEGEKDADRLNDFFRHEAGWEDVATTAPGGACKWRPEYSESLRGADVILWGDNDEAGRRHIALLRKELYGIVARLREVQSAALQQGGDPA